MFITGLSAGTIKDNILYGREGATDEEIREAARSANALDFIEAAPAGFNTPVSHEPEYTTPASTAIDLDSIIYSFSTLLPIF